jgi:hypothetical protein
MYDSEQIQWICLDVSSQDLPARENLTATEQCSWDCQSGANGSKPKEPRQRNIFVL